MSQVDITTTVIDDNIPEVQEPFYLTLVSVEALTPGIGQASLDSNGNVAVITIIASDDPHGIIEFSSMMAFYITDESQHVFLSVLRKFGAIG